MDIRFAYPEEIARWNDLIKTNPDGGEVLQGHEFSTSKILIGWKVRFVMIDETIPVAFAERRVQGIGKFWYATKGPGLTDPAKLAELLPAIKSFARKHRVFAVKLEPPIFATPETRSALDDMGLVHSRAIQTPSTVILDLSPSLDDIFKSLNQKGRHAIRRAERDGVTTQQADYSLDNAKAMYDLLCETAEGRWTARSFEYYNSYWKQFAEEGTGSFFFAFYDGELVAGAFCMYLGEKATYKDGASIRKRTAYGASHLLQWEAIKWMKSHDMKSYDFGGTPPSDRIVDETHPYYGLGRFKTSFNKQVTDYVGCYDIVVNKAKYKLWTRLGERVMIRFYKHIYGEYWY